MNSILLILLAGIALFMAWDLATYARTGNAMLQDLWDWLPLAGIMKPSE